MQLLHVSSILSFSDFADSHCKLDGLYDQYNGKVICKFCVVVLGKLRYSKKKKQFGLGSRGEKEKIQGMYKVDINHELREPQYNLIRIT
jgi:hypothetical protein